MEEEKRVCIVCGKDISGKRSHTNVCSVRCYSKNKYTNSKIIEYKICQICGKDISEKKKGSVACSPKCSSAFYKKNNPDKVRESNKKWSKKNREYLRNYANAKYAENPKKFLAWHMSYYYRTKNKNPDMFRKYTRNNTKSLTDTVVIRYLRRTNFDEIEITPELIETKRQIVLLKRQRKL